MLNMVTLQPKGNFSEMEQMYYLTHRHGFYLDFCNDVSKLKTFFTIVLILKQIQNFVN